MPVILKNNASSILATAITTSDTGIVVANGSRFPTVTAGDYFYATLVSPAGTTEIIKVTARVGNSLTVVRAQDGSTAASFASGALLGMRVNAASVTDLVDEHDQAAEISIVDAGGHYTSTNVEGALQEVGVALGTVSRTDVAELLADTALTYSNVTAGDIVRTLAEGYAYEVAASAATNHHVTTAGGVKLYVLTPDARAFGAGAGGDDTLALQTFFNAIAATDFSTATFDGSFNISNTITFGASGAPLTVKIEGRAVVTATATMPHMFEISNFINGEIGYILAIGTGTQAFASRTVRAGFVLSGCQRSLFRRLLGANFSFATVVQASANNTLAEIQHLRGWDSGSGHLAGSLTGNWSNPVDSGSANSTTQRTVVDVTELPPSYVSDGTYGAVGDTPYMVRIGSDLHLVTAVDTVNSKITVYPWVSTAATLGAFQYVFGGALWQRGADANIIKVGAVDATRAGIAVSAQSLYGPRISRVTAQSCGVGFALGRWLNASSWGTEIGNLYTENCYEDLVVVAQPSTSVNAKVTTAYEINAQKIRRIGARSSGTTYTQSLQILTGIEVYQRGAMLQAEKPGENATSSSVTISPDRRDKMYMQSRNTFTVVLGPIDTNLNRLTGVDSFQCVFFGTGASKQPTGTVTFTPPAGWTVNGGASAAFSALTAPPHFAVFYETASLNVVVSHLNA